MGLNFAERLARPVGRLVEAAEQVGAGDLDVQVRIAREDDEVALLGRVFNQMTRQLKGQREHLLEKQPPDRCAAAAVRFGAGVGDRRGDRLGCKRSAGLHQPRG